MLNLKIKYIDTEAEYKLKVNAALNKKLSELQKQALETGLLLMQKMISNFFDKEQQIIDVETNNFKKQEKEKQEDLEDRLKAGVVSKKQAEEEKKLIAEYYEAIYQEQERKKYEVQVQQFRVQQYMDSAKIAMATALAVMELMAMSGGLGAPLIPWMVGLGVAQAALVWAQQPPPPPMFAKGGTMPYTGTAILGDGGKNELWVSPSGDFGVSPDVPTYTHLQAGTTIYPDINKLDLMSVLGYSKKYDDDYDMNRLEKVMLSIDKKLSKNKQKISIKGLSLFEQLQHSEKIKSRRSSLMN
jgi:hypothetical protein